MNKNFLRVSLSLLMVFITGSAQAFIDVNVKQDGYIDDFTKSQIDPPDGIPDRVSDTNALLAGRGEFFDQFNAFNVDSRAIVTFDLSSYAGLNLSSAYLTGFGTRVDNKGSLDPITGQFYLYSGDGLVGLDDFNAPAVLVGTNSFQADPQGFDLKPFQLDVTSSLQSLLDNGNPFAEFRVQSADPTVFINAGETAPDSGFSKDPRWEGPKLQLAFNTNPVVPEPATLLLLGGGWAALAIRQRRKKTHDRRDVK
jgi:hypothetical protein